jgi:hypothetical protein
MHADFFRLFNDLIQLPSVSSANRAFDMGNRPIIEHLATVFSALGFSCEVMDIAGQPHNNRQPSICLPEKQCTSRARGSYYEMLCYPILCCAQLSLRHQSPVRTPKASEPEFRMDGQ